MKTKRLLLVEDNPDDVELMLRAFRLNEMYPQVFVAHDGAEAIEWLYETGAGADATAPLPSVVLLDLKLPKIDGLSVLRRIRSEPRTAMLPVVILTSSNERVDLIDSYRLGANSFVRKPVQFGDLLKVIKGIGGYWLGINEVPVATEAVAR